MVYDSLSPHLRALLLIVHLENHMTVYQFEMVNDLKTFNVFYRSGANSPRENGELQYRDNSFSFIKATGTFPFAAEVGLHPFKIGDPNYNYSIGEYPKSDIYQFGSRPYLPDFPWDDIINSLKIQLLGDLQDMDVNLAVAYAEKNATADLVKGTASKLLRAARALKRGDLPAVARHLGIPRSGLKKDHTGAYKKTHFTRDVFSEKWLEYSYGWVPLYNDMYGSLVASHKAIDKKPNRVTRHTKQASYKNQFTLRKSVFYGLAEYDLVEKHNARYKVSCVSVITNPNANTLSSLGLANPALVVWELVSFSFVIDWVLPIGSWLTATGPLLGVNVEQVFTTYFSESSYNSTGSTGSFGYDVSKQHPPTEGDPLGWTEYGKATVSYARSPGNSTSVIIDRVSDNLSVTFPKPQLPNSWAQAASALSLFHVFMSKAGRF